MSILIKGMEIPKIDLEWRIIRGKDGKWYAIDVNAETSDGEWHEIVPVPPHGRLIESKAFLKVAHETDDFSLDELAHLAVLVAATPTIIPAEEGE